MSDYDPNRMDPNRPDPIHVRREASNDFNWNWIIGGVAALVVLIVALSFLGRDDRTADTGQPPATTGQASPTQSQAPKAPTPNAMPNLRPAPAEQTPPMRPANPNQ